MLIIALVLALIGLAALVFAVVTGYELVAWVCIGVCAVGVVLLIIDALRERRMRAEGGNDEDEADQGPEDEEDYVDYPEEAADEDDAETEESEELEEPEESEEADSDATESAVHGEDRAK